MRGGLLVTMRRMACAEGEPPARARTNFSISRPLSPCCRASSAAPSSIPPPPTQGLPPPTQGPPDAPPVQAEQGKGHTDPPSKSGWSKLILNHGSLALEPCGPSTLGTVGPELGCKPGQDSAAAGEGWDRVRAGRVMPGPCLSLRPSVSSSWDGCRQKGAFQPAKQGDGRPAMHTYPPPTPATPKEQLDFPKRPHTRQEGGQLGGYNTNKAHPPLP